MLIALAFLARPDLSNAQTLAQGMAQAQALTQKDKAELATRALWQGAYDGDVAQIRAALDAGVNVDIRDYDGQTPLMTAAVNSPNLEAIKLLLDRNANVNVASHDGWTPLMNALLRSDRKSTLLHQIVGLLLSKNASVSVKTRDGYTPVTGAVMDGDDPELMRMILAKHPDVDVPTKPYGFTALMYASSYGYLDIAKLLVRAHAKLDLLDTEGRTALDLTQPDGFDTPDRAARKLALGRFLRSKGAHHNNTRGL